VLDGNIVNYTQTAGDKGNSHLNQTHVLISDLISELFRIILYQFERIQSIWPVSKIRTLLENESEQ